MGEAVKWALLVAGAVVIIGLIIALPFVQFINVGEFGALLNGLVNIIGGALVSARGLLNNFLTPFGVTVLSGLLFYLFAKAFITNAVKIIIWIYHFIFK